MSEMAAEEFADELVTRECPDCSFTVTGPASGRGSAAWKLGTHRARSHGYRAPGKKERSARSDAVPTPIGILRDVAADLERPSRSPGPPTVDELTKAMGRGLYTLGVGAAAYFAETDPTCQTEQDRETVQNYLEIPAAAARDMMSPIAKAFGRSKINARYGRTVVDNVDVVTSITELGMVAVRYRRYFRIRAQMERAMLGQAPPPSAWKPAADGDPLAPVPPGMGTVMADPHATKGVVVDAAMVAAMRNGGGR